MLLTKLLIRKIFVTLVSLKDPYDNYLIELFRKIAEKALSNLGNSAGEQYQMLQ
jgi:hypothetical protein